MKNKYYDVEDLIGRTIKDISTWSKLWHVKGEVCNTYTLVIDQALGQDG